MTFTRSFALLSLGVLLSACGGSTDSGSFDQGDTSESSDASSDSSATDGGSDGTATDGSTDGPSVDGGIDAIATDAPADGDARPVCSEAPTKARCQECCGVEHPAGEKTFFAAELACACTDAICKSVCATTACATPPTAPSDACKTCLADTLRPKPDAGGDSGVEGACVDSVKSACSSDAKCVAYATCLGTCK
jgi:hypothetical protein